MKARKILAFLLSCAFLAGCNVPPPPQDLPQEPPDASESASRENSVPEIQEAAEDPMTIGDLLAAVNEAHQSIEKPQIDFEEYTQEASSDPFNVFAYQQGSDFVPEAILTLERARADIDILFRALQSTYGPYYYFGGDETFWGAKEAILDECMAAPELTAGFLAESIRQNLSFMRDGHFKVNDQGLAKTVLGYVYSGLACEKTGEGYRTLKDGKLVETVERIQSPGAGTQEEALERYAAPDEAFRMSIADDGSVIWCPVVLAPAPDDLASPGPELLVHYSDGSEETIAADTWESGYSEDDQMVQLHYNQEIPVIFVRNMGFDEAKGDELGKAFLDMAEQLRDEPVLIVDLRSNGGGNIMLPLKWFQTYAGQFVPSNSVGLQYWTEEDMREYAKNTDNPYYTSYETLTELAGSEPVSEDYMKEMDQPDAFIPNERLLILLTGKNTASAAETFTDLAHNLENTLVIGQNTFGCFTSNAYTVIYLPESNIAIQLGSDLRFFPEGDFQEFVGYQPDLWVSGDAEAAAVKLVKKLSS